MSTGFSWLAQAEETRPAAEGGDAAGTSADGFSRRQFLRSAAATGAAAVAAATVAEPATAGDDAVTPPAAAGIRSVAEWERMFLSIWARDHAIYQPKSVSTDSQSYYNLAYSVDANGAMFHATGKVAYLDRALLYVENTIRNARPSSTFPASRFRDRYYGWVCRQPGAYNGQEVTLYEIYLWRYVTRLLRLMRQNAAVWANSAYQQRFQRILAFSETNIFEKWYSRGPQSYVYRSVPHITAHFGYIALDLARLTSDAARRSRYLTVFNNINHALPNRPGCSLRAQLIAHPTVSGGVFWDDQWGVFARPGTDTSHANGVVSFIVEAQEVGVEWTRADTSRLVTTLDRAILKGGSTTATYLDGSGAEGWINDGWCKLGRYSVALQRRLETYQRARNCQLWGNCALNAKLLLSST